jgi:hypothetical protein
MMTCLSFDIARCTTARICAASPTIIATERVRISQEHKTAKHARSSGILSVWGEPSAHHAREQVNQVGAPVFEKKNVNDIAQMKKTRRATKEERKAQIRALLESSSLEHEGKDNREKGGGGEPRIP